MRITNNQIANLIYGSTMRNLETMARLQEMAASGHQINSYVDDPKGVGLIQEYEGLLDRNTQYQRNIDRARVMVTQTDLAMMDLIEVLRDAREVAQTFASETHSDAQMSAIAAAEVDSLLDQAMTIMNQKVEGNFLFSGFRTDVSPFLEVGSSVVYQGDRSEIMVAIGPNTEMSVNIPGSELMGSGRSSLIGSADMAPRLTGATSLSTLGGGAGWTPGAISYTDNLGLEYEVDLSGAGTIDDILTMLNAAGLNASINTDQTGLTLSDPGGGAFTVRDMEGIDTALTLGIIGSSDTGQIDGIDIRGNPEWTTDLAEISSVNANLPLGLMQVTIDGTDILIDLNAATTLADVKAIFEATIAAAPVTPLYVDISGNSLEIYSETGAIFEINNLGGGGLAAFKLGLEGEGKPARLFTSMTALSTALSLNDHDGILAAMNEFDALEDHILQLEIQTGGRETMLDWMENHIAERDLQLTQSLSLVRDADVVKVATDLSRAETAYQSSLLVSAKLMETNLLDYL